MGSYFNTHIHVIWVKEFHSEIHTGYTQKDMIVCTWFWVGELVNSTINLANPALSNGGNCLFLIFILTCFQQLLLPLAKTIPVSGRPTTFCWFLRLSSRHSWKLPLFCLLWFFMKPLHLIYGPFLEYQHGILYNSAGAALILPPHSPPRRSLKICIL